MSQYFKKAADEYILQKPFTIAGLHKAEIDLILSGYKEAFLDGAYYANQGKQWDNASFDAGRKEGAEQMVDYIIALLRGNKSQSEDQEVLNRAATWLSRVMK